MWGKVKINALKHLPAPQGNYINNVGVCMHSCVNIYLDFKNQIP